MSDRFSDYVIGAKNDKNEKDEKDENVIKFEDKPNLVSKKLGFNLTAGTILHFLKEWKKKVAN